SLRPESMPETVSASSLRALPTTAFALAGSLFIMSMPSNQPCTKSRTVSGARSMRSCRATSVSAMLFVAAAVETRMCAWLPAVATARPVLHDHRLRLGVVLGQNRGLARPVVDRVPHDVDVAFAERGELRGGVLDEHELHVETVFLAVLRRAVRIEAVVEDHPR